jgi:hypothetical protein
VLSLSVFNVVSSKYRRGHGSECVKIAVFLDVILGNLIEKYQLFRGTCCLHVEANLKIDAKTFSKILVPMCQNVYCYIPRGTYFQP